MRRALVALCLVPLALTACQDPNATTKTDNSTYTAEPVDSNAYTNNSTTYTTPSNTYSGTTGSTGTSGSTYTPTNPQPYGSGMTSSAGSNMVTSTGSSSTAGDSYPATPSYTSNGGSGYTKSTSEVYEPSTGRSSTGRASSGSTGRTYVVKKGDTLSEISQRMYGTSTKWRKILSANKKRIPDEKKLRVGTKLVIP